MDSTQEEEFALLLLAENEAAISKENICENFKSLNNVK